MLTIFGAVAQLERDYIKERQREGRGYYFIPLLFFFGLPILYMLIFLHI